MGRPPRFRFVDQLPASNYFKPRGVPISRLAEVVLTVDELEAMRLADLEGMYQEEAARQMNVSRQTFGRIISSARGKVAEALVKGRALRIGGGEFELSAPRTFQCEDCGRVWQVVQGADRPAECAECHGANLHRASGGGWRGFGRGFGRRGGTGPGRTK